MTSPALSLDPPARSSARLTAYRSIPAAAGSACAILRDFGDELADGDVYLLNDPWEAGGNHLPDWVIARPIFVDGQMVGLTCNRPISPISVQPGCD